MIKLSRMADYGVVLSTELARAREATQTAPELASRTALPLPTVSKVLKLLAQSGVLESQRGIKGGYALARPAADISIAEIIAAVDGPISLTGCIATVGNNCEIESLCPAKINWQTINDAVVGALGSVTLADMAAPTIPAAFRVPEEAATGPARSAR